MARYGFGSQSPMVLVALGAEHHQHVLWPWPFPSLLGEFLAEFSEIQIDYLYTYIYIYIHSNPAKRIVEQL